MRFGVNKKFMDKLREKNWTFAQLAERLNGEYSAQTLFQYADGRRMPNKADKKKIANAMGCLVNELF